MQLSNDLFVRLINHRVSNQISRKEDFLTEVFFWILEQDTQLTIEFIQWLDPSSRDYPILIQSVNTQVHLGKFGRVDAQIQTKQHSILFESKVDAPYCSEQIERYLKYSEANNALVYAIVPSIQLLDIEVPEHHCFGGLHTWEDVYSWLHKQLDNSALILLPHIESLLRLLQHYGLEPIDRKTATWEDQSDPKNIKYIRSIGAVISQVIPKLQSTLMKHDSVPELYVQQLDSITPWNGSGFLYSGKGPSPRPILSHVTMLTSKYEYPWLRLDWCLGFSSINPSKPPMVYVQLFTGRIQDFPNFLEKLSTDIPLPLHRHTYQQLQDYFYNCMEFLATEVRSQIPDCSQSKAHRTENFIVVPLFRTDILLSNSDSTEELQVNITKLYETTLRIFLSWTGWKQDWSVG